MLDILISIVVYLGGWSHYSPLVPGKVLTSTSLYTTGLTVTA